MNPAKRVVLDANILLRGVFGIRVRELLETYEDSVIFLAPDLCFEEARRYIPQIASLRRIDQKDARAALRSIAQIVNAVDKELYQDLEPMARKRIAARDPADWPVIATALLFDCPIWTEDRDFFGSGIAVWTSDRIEQYLQD